MLENSLFFSIPHSGEKIPHELTPWLSTLPEPLLMCDVDRYVDLLYEGILRKNHWDFVKTEWHRYAGDLNRLAEDVDQDSVQGHQNPSGKFSRGFHWVVTTTLHRLMNQPMTQETHEKLVKLIYDPFHQQVQSFHAQKLKQYGIVYHIDLHSMPSLGTKEHRDPGEHRADVVISDQMGKSCSENFRDLVVAAYAQAGFRVGVNWPYYGGRITEQYGQPSKNIHVLQVELNRGLYMNETSKKILPSEFDKTQKKLEKALEYIRRRQDFFLGEKR